MQKSLRELGFFSQVQKCFVFHFKGGVGRGSRILLASLFLFLFKNTNPTTLFLSSVLLIGRTYSRGQTVSMIIVVLLFFVIFFLRSGFFSSTTINRVNWGRKGRSSYVRSFLLLLETQSRAPKICCCWKMHDVEARFCRYGDGTAAGPAVFRYIR